MVVIMFIIAGNKKGKTDMKKPSKTISISTDIDIKKAMKTIISFAQTNGYKVDDFNEDEAIIVISNSASARSYGFIFPIYLSKLNDNKVNIEIGIKSKSGTQTYGPIFNKNLDDCVNGIKTAIYAAS